MYCSALFSSGLNPNEELESRIPIPIPSRSFEKGHVRLSISRPQLPSSLNIRHQFLFESRIRVAAGSQGELSDEDDDLCPVDCVREFKTDEEFLKILDRGKETGALVVVDFYRTSCGSCKYIEQGFAKLCKGSGDEEAPVIFLKHNVSISTKLFLGKINMGMENELSLPHFATECLSLNVFGFRSLMNMMNNPRLLND